MSLDGTLIGTAESRLPDASGAGFADKLYRLDGGHSLANDESVWTPGENVGRSIEFSSTCWLIQRRSEWLLWDTGVPESALNDPKGWSTLPKLIVYHLDKTLTDHSQPKETAEPYLGAITAASNEIRGNQEIRSSAPASRGAWWPVPARPCRLITIGWVGALTVEVASTSGVNASLRVLL